MSEQDTGLRHAVASAVTRDETRNTFDEDRLTFGEDPAPQILISVTSRVEAVGNKIRLNSQGWEDARIIGERRVLPVVACKGSLDLLPKHKPAKFENIVTARPGKSDRRRGREIEEQIPPVRASRRHHDPDRLPP